MLATEAAVDMLTAELAAACSTVSIDNDIIKVSKTK